MPLFMTTPPVEPRLAPIPFSQWDEETRTVLLSHLRRPERYLSGKPDAPPMPVVLEVLAHHLKLSEPFLTFTDVMASDESSLEPAIRELVILRVAWRTQSGYEWNQHRRMGADAGISDAKIDAVPKGGSAEVWSSTERALLSMVDELVDVFAVSDQTWDTLSRSFAPQQMLELLFVAGGYLCMAGVLNSIGLRGQLPPEGGGSA
jgi:4-carboxymuconolactone decarboxylase